MTYQKNDVIRVIMKLYQSYTVTPVHFRIYALDLTMDATWGHTNSAQPLAQPHLSLFTPQIYLHGSHHWPTGFLSPSSS